MGVDILNIGIINFNKNYKNSFKSKVDKNNDHKIDNQGNLNKIEYRSKKDGKTYTAAKVSYCIKGKEFNGFYVCEKNPKNGFELNGEFLDHDSFMKKIIEELPPKSD